MQLKFSAAGVGRPIFGSGTRKLLILIFAVIFFVFFAIPTEIFSQNTRSRRLQERRQEALREAQEQQRRLEAERNAPGGVPRPKPAVTNVDVQMAISRMNHKTFAEAKKASVRRLTDGEPVWLYVSFKGKLGDFVFSQRNPEDPGQLEHLLFIEIGPQGDPTTLSKYIFRFSRAELERQEIKLSLAPGIPGRNLSSPVFLEVAGNRSPGLWNNEIRLTNSTAIPRSPNDDLARTAFSLDLSKGVAQYRQMRQEYNSMFLRGTADPAQMPIPGTFYSLPIKNRVQAELVKYGIRPVRFYFAADEWVETGVSASSPRQIRSVFAAFTYRREESCYYGVAEVKEAWDLLSKRYLPEGIETKRDVAIPCSNLE